MKSFSLKSPCFYINLIGVSLMLSGLIETVSAQIKAPGLDATPGNRKVKEQKKPKPGGQINMDLNSSDPRMNQPTQRVMITKKSDPQSTKVNTAQANREASQNKALFGFEKVFFSQKDIEVILQESKVKGVRFYTAVTQDFGVTDQGIIGAGITDKGVETGKFIYSTGIRSKEVSPRDAQDILKKSKQINTVNISCAFTADELSELIGRSDSNGIHLKPAEYQGQKTLFVVSAHQEGPSSSDTGTSGLKGMAPCPPACGGVTLGDYVSPP